MVMDSPGCWLRTTPAMRTKVLESVVAKFSDEVVGIENRGSPLNDPMILTLSKSGVHKVRLAIFPKASRVSE